MPAKAANCGGCNKTVGKPSVQCVMCDLWYHLQCGNINDDMFKLINSTSESSGQHCWSCRSCQSAVKSLNKKVVQLEKQLQNLEKSVDTNKADISDVREKVTTIENEVKKLSSEDRAKKSVEQTKDDVFIEINEREARKLNLVIHKVPEPEPTVTGDRNKKKSDEDKLTAIFSSIGCEVNFSEEVKFFYRVGKREINSEPNRQRPVIVGFRSLEKREAILNKARGLQDTVHTEIRIVPDLTHRQRQEEDKLRREAEHRNETMTEEEAGNFLWTVVGPRGQRRLRKVPRNQNDDGRSRSKRVRSAEETSPGPSRKR